MIKHKQLFRHNPPDSHGDCLRACYASILDIHYAKDVPHFMDTGDTEKGLQAEREWLDENGLFNIPLKFNQDVEMQTVLDYMGNLMPGIYYMFSGRRKNKDYNHVAVGLNDRIIHDPAQDVEDGETCIALPCIMMEGEDQFWIVDIPVRREGLFTQDSPGQKATHQEKTP